MRVLTNRSSGKQGHAVAAAAARRGARVTLVTTSSLPADSPLVTVVPVESAADMEAALAGVVADADVVVMAAAVADYRPKAPSERKLTKDDGVPDIVLEQTPDILAGLVAARRPGQRFVGFAAETEDAVARGRRKLERKGVDLLVVNDVAAPGVGFDHDTNAVTILDAAGDATDVPLTSKDEVADAILDRVVGLLAPPTDRRKTT